MFKTIKLFFLLLFGLSVNKVSYCQEFIIPIGFDGGRPVITLNIGEEKIEFLFDTGAGGTVVDNSLIELLNAKVIGKMKVGSPGSSKALDGKRIEIPSLKLGGISLDNEKAVAIPLSQVMSHISTKGIIGPNSFRGFVITLDYKNEELIFNKGGLSLKSPETFKTELSRIISLPLTIDDVQYEGHIDTGSGYCINIPYHFKDKLKFIDEPKFYKKGKTVSSEFNMYKATLKGKIKVGNINIENPEVLLVEGDFTAINIGSQFIKNYKVSIDVVNNLMSIKQQKN